MNLCVRIEIEKKKHQKKKKKKKSNRHANCKQANKNEENFYKFLFEYLNSLFSDGNMTKRFFILYEIKIKNFYDIDDARRERNYPDWYIIVGMNDNRTYFTF